MKKLDRYLEDQLFYQDLPGLCVSVKKGEELDYKKALGHRDYINKEELKTNNIFHCASVTKTVTGTAVMQLVERGNLSLDAKPEDIIKGFKLNDSRQGEITVGSMLSHTSGMGDVYDYGWDKPETDKDAMKRYILSDEVRNSTMLWAPAENRFSYSNMAYEALGCVVAEVSGMEFEEYVKKNIFEPLHMDNTTLLTFERTDHDNMAVPHVKNETKHIVREPYYPYNRAHCASSTMTSDIYDLEKLAQAHIKGSRGEAPYQLLKKETYKLMWEKRTEVPNNGEGMGLTWFIREQNGYTLYGHEGTDDGFRASFWICPELDMHITVLSNMTKAPVKKISKGIFDIII